MVGYFPVGVAYGILMSSAGYGAVWSALAGLFVYAGSLQMLMVTFFENGVPLLTVTVTALLLSSRHLFYGISFIGKFRSYGAWKYFLIYGMSDESYSLLCSYKEQDGADEKWVHIFSTALIWIYWIFFSVLGGLVGSLITFNTDGIDFALTALFLLALNPWHMVMSRWALEANMLPHVVLLAAELLLIGTRRRWALYLSMVVFGLAPYAYGLAAVSVPCILLPMAIFLTARKKVKPLDLAVCVAIFAAVSGPYYATMVINAFGLETMTLGRMTMPRFEKSQRVNDISLGSPNPYLSMAQKLRDFLPTATGYYPAEGYSGIAWADTMYPFVIPAALYGWYRLCRDRRRLALRGSEEPLRDGGMLILVWMFAAIINTTMVGAVVNRNNILYYPWILCAAYALWQMGRRLRTALAAMVVMIAIGFAGACGVYFTDADYQTETANTFLYGAQEALREAWDWDCDRYYLTTMSRNDGEKVMTAQVMFAHRIDYAMRSEEEELRGSDGQPNGWYFTERYVFQDFRDFTPDPTECAVYIVRQNEKALFDEADYLITDFGNFAAVYPRYWAE